MLLTESDKKRFWEKVKKIEGGCWEWTASQRNQSGYGGFGINKKIYLAHRLTYQIYKGPIEPGQLILHTCDNRKCVNPDHLYSGTPKDNMSDCSKRGRIVSSNRNKIYCKFGHELSGNNLYFCSSRPKKRICKKCCSIRARKYRTVLILKRGTNRRVRSPLQDPKL